MQLVVGSVSFSSFSSFFVSSSYYHFSLFHCSPGILRLLGFGSAPSLNGHISLTVSQLTLHDVYGDAALLNSYIAAHVNRQLWSQAYKVLTLAVRAIGGVAVKPVSGIVTGCTQCLGWATPAPEVVRPSRVIVAGQPVSPYDLATATGWQTYRQHVADGIVPPLPSSSSSQQLVPGGLRSRTDTASTGSTAASSTLLKEQPRIVVRPTAAWLVVATSHRVVAVSRVAGRWLTVAPLLAVQSISAVVVSPVDGVTVMITGADVGTGQPATLAVSVGSAVAAAALVASLTPLLRVVDVDRALFGHDSTWVDVTGTLRARLDNSHALRRPTKGAPQHWHVALLGTRG